MGRCYKYAIAQLRANPMRDERLNVALVVFEGDRLYVHRARNLDKLRAISGALDTAVVTQALSNLAAIDHGIFCDGILTPEERLEVLQTMSPLGFSSFGQFFASDSSSYEHAISRLLSQLVEPEPNPKPTRPINKSRLLSSLKAAFRAEKILAQKGEGIDSHRILAHEPLADGLNADFLLMNGAMHIVQAVDASHLDKISKAIKEIGVSSLVFEHAKMKFGQSKTQARLVYSVNAQLETSLSPALFAAEHQGAELINWQSQDQRARFIVRMSSLAEPQDTQSKVDFGSVNASSQDPKLLN